MNPIHRDVATSLRLGLVILDLGLDLGLLAALLSWNLGRESQCDPLQMLCLVPISLILFHASKAWMVTFPGRLIQWTTSALRGHLAVAVAILIAAYVLHISENLPRLTFFSWLLGGGILLVSARTLAWSVLRRQRMKSGYLGMRVVLIGSWRRCREVHERLTSRPDGDLWPVAVATDDDVGDLPEGVVLGRAADAISLAIEHGAPRVVLCAGLDDKDFIEAQVKALMPFPIEITLIPDLGRFPLFCHKVEMQSGIPTIDLSASPLSDGDLLVKRIEDIVLSLLILALISPLLLLIAVAVRLTSPGPVLFVQSRHGLMGRSISVLKFRTMTWSPPSATEAHLPSAMGGEQDDASRAFLNPKTDVFLQTVKGDQRLTSIGGFLRRTSLDELPQFINVLRGDMSIVGPRPHARRHNLQFLEDVPDLMRRHFVKPGITGLAQIRGARGRTATVRDMRVRVDHDLEYIRDWSLWLDLKIIATTAVIGFFTSEP